MDITRSRVPDTPSGQRLPTLVPPRPGDARRSAPQVPLVPGLDELLEAFADGVVIVASDGRLLEANRRFTEMTGFSREELVGTRPPYPFWPPEHLALLEPTLAVLLHGRTERDVILARRSGERFAAILASGSLRPEAVVVPGIVLTVKDASIRRRAEAQRAEVLMEELASRAEAELLNEIATAAAGEDDVENVLAVTLDRLAGIVRFTGGSIALVEQDELVLRAARGRFAEQARGQRVPRGTGTSWRIIESRAPFFSNDLLETTVRPMSRDGDDTLRSYIAVPLVWRGEAIGVLEVDSTSPHAFRERDLGLLQSVAAALSGPIQLARRRAAETRALEESERARAHLAFLAEASRILASSLDYVNALADVTRLAVPAFADLCTVSLVGDEGHSALSALAHVDPAEEEKLRGFGRRRTADADEDRLQPLVASGEPLLLADVPDSILQVIADDEDELEALRRSGFRSGIIVPLLARSTVIGRIGLGLTRPGGRYGPDDIAMAEELARRIATAVDTARLYEAEQRARQAAEEAADRTTRLQAITSALSATLTRSQAAGVIVEQATEALGALAGSVAVLESADQLVLLRAVGYPPAVMERYARVGLDAPLPLSDAVRTERAVFIESFEGLQRDYPEFAHGAESFSRGAWLALPLRVEDRTLGAVALTFAESRVFSQEDRAFMLAVAQQCAQALERARLFDAEQEAQQRVGFLAQASAVLGSSLDYHQTLGQLAEMTVHAFADACLIDIVDADGRAVRTATATSRAGRADGSGSSPAELIREVLRTGQATVIAEVPELEAASDDEHGRLAHLDFLRSLSARSAMVVPLPARHRVLGAMTLVSTVPGRGYGPPDLALATELARRAAAAVDAARIYELLSEFKTTLDTTLDGLYMFDPRTLGFFYVNQGAVDGSGYTRDELLRMKPSDLQPEFDEGGFRALLQPLLDGSMSSTTLVTTHRRKDGLDVPVELFMQYVRPPGVRGRVIMIVRDISDRIETGERLHQLALAERALNAELTTIIRAMGDAVLVFNGEGRTIFSNPAADALFPDGGPGGFQDVLERFVDHDDRAPRLGETKSQGPIELPLKGSAQRWFELTAYPVFTPASITDQLPDRDVVETIVFMREVTEARRAQMARDAFIGVLSHELRTPVTTIYGNSKLLVRGDRQLDPEASREAHRDIEVESERLYRLVEDLLVLARYGQNAGRELGNEPLLLQRIVPAVMRSEQERWSYTRFESVIPANLPAVQGDQTYVEQVIRNLLSNAAKYSGPGGRVRAVLRAQGDEATVRVLDEGPGFAAEEADHLFELFYRSPSTADKASGAGIGLFVCRLLVEAMGGRIWARPRASGGAEFGFVLKLAIEEGA